MTTGADFYGRVRAGARLASDEEAALVGRQVLRRLGQVLPQGVCRHLAAVLPPDAAVELQGPAAADAPDGLVDRQVFIGSLVNSMDTEYGYDESLGGLDLVSVYADDDAATLVQGVFSAVRALLDDAARLQVERYLPEEIADWWRRAP